MSDNLKIQTVVIQTTESPKNSIRVLENLISLDPKTYFSGNTKIKAFNTTETVIAKSVNHVILASADNNSFTLKFQESGSIDFITLEEIKQFNYSGKKPIDIYVMNPLGIDVTIKVVYANDLI